MSTSQLEPLKLWGLISTNPPKVAFILEELSIPYEVVPLSHADVKTERYLAINPNGRMPALQDPNTGLTIWESNAIITYLIETYDKENTISFPPHSHEAWHATQFLFFQASGQGPYYGNGFYFLNISNPPNPAAALRFSREAIRVTHVLNTVLTQASADSEGRRWLVGGKLSYADLSFLTYQLLARLSFAGKDHGYNEADFPEVQQWIRAMMSRDSVRKILMAAEPWSGPWAKRLWD